MGAIIPQVVTEDRASGAQVIDGGLVFDGGSTQYLEKTFASEGNRQSWTWSGWVKKQKITNDRMVLFGGYSAGSDTGWIELGYDDDKFYYTQNSVAGQSTEVFRDTSGWHHVVINYNGSNVVFYSNGEQIYSVSKSGDLGINSAGTHRIGRSPSGNTRYFYGQITNSYFIDGQALTPSNFGFTDGLTNTWRPKKYSGTFGANGFYLPMDGNTPISQDHSGNANDFTPVALGNTVELNKATGALPILNTNGGGTVARVGVRTDAYASSLEAALPLVGISDDVSDLVNSANTARTVTTNGNAAASTETSNFYGGSFKFDGSGDYLSIPASSDFNLLGDGTFTIEFFFYASALSGGYADYVGVFDGGTTGLLIYEQGGNFDAYINGAQRVTTTHPGAGKWHHAALTRDGTTLRLFVNGVLKSSSTASLGSDYSGALQIGGASGRNGINGYIQDVRVYKGVAKYTSNFTVASTNPDILPDTPSGVATKTALTKIHEGAVGFAGGNDDYLTVSPGADFAFGTGDFTIEMFVYHNTRGTYDYLIDGRNSGQTSGPWGLSYGYSSGTTLQFASSAGLAIAAPSNPPLHKWFHVAVARSGTSLKMFIDGVAVASATNSTDFSTQPTISYIGTRYSTEHSFDGFISNLRVVKGTALYTSDFTVPTEPLTNVTNTKLLCCQSNRSQADASASPQINSTINSGTPWSFFTNGTIFANRPKYNLFDGSTSTFMAPGTSGVAGISNVTLSIPGGGITSVTSVRVYVGSNQPNNSPSVTLNSDSAQAISVDSQYVTLTNPTSGTLNSITLTGNATSSTGNLVEFAAIEVNGTVLRDPVSRVGDAGAITLNPFNTDINTIRGQETGYPTLNPLFKNTNISPTNGNLDIVGTNTSHRIIGSTISVSSGLWYWEVKINSYGSGGIGLITNGTSLADGQYIGASNSVGWFGSTTYNNASSASYGSGFAAGNVIGVAFDATNGTLEYYQNGASLGTAFTGLTSGPYYPGVSTYNTSDSYTLNFGQKPFKYAPPDGFQALTGSSVRPETVIPDPDQYVDVKTYAGNGGTQVVGDFNFSPDLVWLKARDGALNHRWINTVNGVTSTVASNLTTAGVNSSAEFTKFTDDGFSVTQGGSFSLNSSSYDYVAWAWKAGGSKNTFNVDDVGYASAAAAGLNAGSLALTGASVGTKQGFSIVRVTAQTSGSETISHGLSSAPQFMIVKSTANAYSWVVWHKDLTSAAYSLILNTTAAQSNGINAWNSTLPTSSVFTLGAAYANAGVTITHCWHDVPGLQKFGSYVGNGSSDGPMIVTDFKPALIWVKMITSTGHWLILDNSRNSSNVVDNKLAADLADTENASNVGGSGLNAFDFLSNGFKCRSNTGSSNSSGQTYIYCAWAEAPAFNMFGASSNAR